ncbi:MAG: MoxR family ATPase [Roseiflexus sp.]|uniref:AAA family ATPase n=1 Tax=Roseiflexus sp. TaxID=2562120 RepID=UPI0025D6C3C5|nr:MoxR family ATPase [Roseiflexus sp.]MCL6541548.1 MoxR family ATPase [Roseiflexus sp.]
MDRLQKNIAEAVLGKPELIRLALIAVLADGHILVEDMPGVGKTLLAKALARSLDCSFHRIQFTPDLLPSDLIGTSVFQQHTGRFVFQPGPIFAQIILADEINRATPRTQSALLEAMSDRQVSVDGVTHPLGSPFLVLATQNPFEFEGTYPLPESQLDRFLMRLQIGYPSREAEFEILASHRDGEPVDRLTPVIHAEQVVQLQTLVRKVRLEASVAHYILDVVQATRTHADIALGASPRAAIGLYRAAQASALLDGRDYVIPDDVKALAAPVLAHRLIISPSARIRNVSAAEVIADVLKAVAVPGARAGRRFERVAR